MAVYVSTTFTSCRRLVFLTVCCCVISVCSQTDISGMSEDIASWLAQLDGTLDKSLTFTCRGRCGESGNMPCSCAASCLVYDICCENMTLDCADTLREGQEKFSLYTGADIVCGVRRVFKIASCPDDTSRNKTEISYVDVELEISEKAKAKTIDMTPEEINRAMLNAPVTDSMSGFTFLNSFIYDCYAGLGSTSKPLYWALNFQYNETGVTEFGRFGNIFANSPYLETFNNDILMSHKCDKNVISSCDDSELTDLEDSVRDYLETKCKEFTGHVYSKRSMGWQVYHNRYCAYCHEGQHDQLYRQVMGYNPNVFHTLSILVSLNQDGTVHLESSMNVGTWSAAQCPNIDALLSQGTGQIKDNVFEEGLQENESSYDPLSGCKVTDCIDGYEHSSDGRCRGNRYAQIAFGGDNYLELLLCPSALQRIAEFISCGLDLMLDEGAIKYAQFQTPKLTVWQDSKTGRNVYIVEISLLSSGSLGNYVFAFKEREIFPNLHKIAIAVKALYAHIASHGLCPRSKIKSVERIDPLSPDTPYKPKRKTFNELPYALSSTIAKEMVELRGPVVELNATMVCASNFVRRSGSNHNVIYCFDDFVHEKDEMDLEHLLNSTCVSHLETENKPVELSSLKNHAQSLQCMLFSVQGRAVFLLGLVLFLSKFPRLQQPLLV